MDAREYDRIKELLTRHARGELDEAGERELRAWRESDPEHEEMFGRLMSTRNMEEGIRRFVKSPEEEERTWGRILDRTIRRRGRSRRLAWVRYAAAVLVLAGAGVAAWLAADRPEEPSGTVTVAQIEPGKARAELILPEGRRVLLDEAAPDTVAGGLSRQGDTLSYQGTERMPEEKAAATHVLRIPRGGEYTVVLSDGTMVYLNAETELRYPVRFTGGERRVALKGEAYFDVVRDEARAFVVETEDMDVRVLGTSFGVRVYEGEEQALATLVEGRVMVDAGEGETELNPGQQAVFDKEGKNLAVREVDVEQFVGWKDGRLIFDNKPLSFILDELGRWYSFEVFYTSERLKEIRFSLNIEKHKDISQVLKFVERTGKVRFDVNGDTIVVK